MPSDYAPVLPNPLKPPIPDLTSLSDWKKATNAGAFTRRTNQHTLAIDAAIKEYHKADRLWHKYVQLDKISAAAEAWIADKADKADSSRRPAYAEIIKHVLALRRYPQLETIDSIVFRGDTRSSMEVFLSGYLPQKLSPPISIGSDGHTWQDGANSKSQVVSTTLNPRTAIGHYAAGGWLYAMKADEGIDLKENGDFEIAMLGVPSTQIIAAIGKLSINQPNFGNSLMSLADVYRSEVIFIPDEAEYDENPMCTVPAHESRLVRLLLKKLAKQDLTDDERSDLINWVRNA